MASAPVHPTLESLKWILGKWTSTNGVCIFPTMKEVKYSEDVEFFQVGQPNIQFSYNSYDVEKKKPLHREIGFIRIQPGTNKIGFLTAHNNGVTSVEEGEVNNEEIKTESHTVGRLTFGSDPETKKLSRVIKKVGDELEQIVYMETNNTPLSEHLRIRYKRVE
ncbi:hypothetical protein LOTGIDRAFT_231221 [Lottia gigantea]|uniref:THAP4-like heme-binding domain-containing protein n=1 Tax=Lottia gigantea TaxID=225164 RepID=V4A4R6_LOTGI|nr:hypothetical protein LOTGIDRAFT_231221 [Lottia gigantea]ESO98868.1 hypothetical protein LOTGIDRAFT_231221 [Lottia gigantea]